MGKIHFQLNGTAMSATMINSVTGNSGIDFNRIQQVINSLPEKTFILKIYEYPSPYVSLSKVFLIEAENDNFLDGTEIFVKYKKTFQVLPNGQSLLEIDTFDGVDIVDPPLQKTNPSNGSQIIGSFGSITPASTGVGATPTPATTVIKKTIYKSGGITMVPITVTISNSSCSCGADSVGGLHSSYCDIKN